MKDLVILESLLLGYFRIMYSHLVIISKKEAWSSCLGLFLQQQPADCTLCQPFIHLEIHMLYC